MISEKNSLWDGISDSPLCSLVQDFSFLWVNIPNTLPSAPTEAPISCLSFPTKSISKKLAWLTFPNFPLTTDPPLQCLPLAATGTVASSHSHALGKHLGASTAPGHAAPRLCLPWPLWCPEEWPLDRQTVMHCSFNYVALKFKAAIKKVFSMTAPPGCAYLVFSIGKGMKSKHSKNFWWKFSIWREMCWRVKRTPGFCDLFRKEDRKISQYSLYGLHFEIIIFWLCGIKHNLLLTFISPVWLSF